MIVVVVASCMFALEYLASTAEMEDDCGKGKTSVVMTRSSRANDTKEKGSFGTPPALISYLEWKSDEAASLPVQSFFMDRSL